MNLDEERFRIFLEAAWPSPADIAEEIRREAVRDRVPVIRRSTEDILRVMLSAVKPEAILEVGTAVGFSSVFMCLHSDAHIVTVENYKKRIPAALRNFERAGITERVRLIEGDAAEVLPTLEKPFDLVFLDAAKGQYIRLLPDLIRLTAPGGILIADNILLDGEVTDSRYAGERRNRTIHRRMREFVEAVLKHPELETAILQAGDGLSVSVRKTEGLISGSSEFEKEKKWASEKENRSC